MNFFFESLGLSGSGILRVFEEFSWTFAKLLPNVSFSSIFRAQTRDDKYYVDVLSTIVLNKYRVFFSIGDVSYFLVQ